MSQIRLIRKRLDASQAALAEVMGCTQSNISFYEKGQTVPPEAARRLVEHANAKGLALTFDHVYGDATLPEVIGQEGASAAPQEESVKAEG